jgi:HK97 family phage prohead protease
MEKETLCLPLHAVHKADVPKATEFEGYASAYDELVEARVPTRLIRGCFTKTLNENGPRIKLLFDHDPSKPIGKVLELRDEPRGLWGRFRLATTTLASDIAELVREKILDAMSIGFDPVNYVMVDEGGSVGTVRHLLEVRLHEISLVSFPANPMALVTDVHSRRSQSIDVRLGALDAALSAVDQRQAQRREAQVHELHMALIDSIERTLR